MWLSLNRIMSTNEQCWLCVISDVAASKETEDKVTTTST